MVGKSTCGSGETGSLKNATSPAAVRPKVNNVVPIGLRMKGVEGPMDQFSSWFLLPTKQPLASKNRVADHC
jgi:hypothetical protein